MKNLSNWIHIKGWSVFWYCTMPLRHWRLPYFYRTDISHCGLKQIIFLCGPLSVLATRDNAA